MSTKIAPTFPGQPMRPASGGRAEGSPKYIGTWAVEPKYNGWRAVIHLPTGTMWNRHGEPLSVAAKYRDAAAALAALMPGHEWADVEALGMRNGESSGSLVVLDTMERGVPYRERRRTMESLLPVLGRMEAPAHGAVAAAYSEPWSDDASLFLDLEERERETMATGPNAMTFFEGVVAKEVDSRYIVTRTASPSPNAAWVKHTY